MSVKVNILSNYIGQITIAVLNFIFIPTYIKYIGVEAYGLVGIFAVLQVALNTFDAAITPLLSREMSCYLGGKKSLESLRNILRTSEILCLFLGLIFALLIFITADFFANKWFIVENLPIELVSEAIRIAIFVVALRTIEDLYKGVLIGLQRQVILNIIIIIGAVFRFVGVIYALEYFEPTIKTFYYWQLLSSIVSIILFIIPCYNNIPGMYNKAHFSLDEIKNNISFSLGSFSNACASFITTQADKIIISKLIPLTEVSYYTLSVSITNVLVMMAHPVLMAFYPKLVTLRSQGNHESAAKNFHLNSQIMCLTCGVAACSLYFYGEYILGYWTHNPELTQNIMPYVKLLAIGNFILINAFPNNQLTYIAGKPIVSGKISAFSILLIICFTLPLITYFGAKGAAYGTIILNSYVLLAFPIYFNCYLKSEQKTWFFKDFLFPTITIIILFYLSKQFNFVESPDLKGVIVCVLIASIIMILSSFSCNQIRQIYNEFILRFKKSNN